MDFKKVAFSKYKFLKQMYKLEHILRPHVINDCNKTWTWWKPANAALLIWCIIDWDFCTKPACWAQVFVPDHCVSK